MEEGADMCRARCDLALEGLPARLMLGRNLSEDRQQNRVGLVRGHSLTPSGNWQCF